MPRRTATATQPVIHPLTPERWADFERLFGERGACAGCWCMWWRLPAARWRAQRGAPNRDALRAAVQAGPPPGLLETAKAFAHRNGGRNPASCTCRISAAQPFWASRAEGERATAPVPTAAAGCCWQR